MSVSKFKRTLWALREFVNAVPGGISMREFSNKWAYSSMNDEKEPEIPERTFHRIRRIVENVFGVEIECLRGSEPRYRVSANDLEPGSNSLLDLFLNKVKIDDQKSKSIHEILSLIISGTNVPVDDMEAIKVIAERLRRVPREYGEKLIHAVQTGEISKADCCAWDEDYGGYVCVWNDADYQRTDFWLSIGFYNDRVLFYVVTSVQNSKYREMVSELLQIDNGEIYKRDYWWYEPSDKSLFQLDFQTFPDLQEVKHRAEILISRINSLPEDIRKPEE